MTSTQQKFGRNFRVRIDPKDGDPPIVVTMPFTLEFWYQQNLLADLNRLSIDLYNLSYQNRKRIYQDRYDFRLDGGTKDTAPGRTVTLEVGYQNLYRIFSGTIFSASSAREGVNIVTRIECRSGIWDVTASQTFQTIQSGKTVGDVINFLCQQLPTLEIGAIGSFTETLTRPVTLNGNTYKLIREYSNNNVYIDNNKIYVLKNNEVIAGDAFLISDATGLLETPRRDEGFLTVTTLLEPGVNMGTLVNLQSSIQPNYNGQYKVIGIQHQGTISGAVCGTARSVFSLLQPNRFGKGAFEQVKQ